MTEFFQPTTHGRADCTGNGCRSMVCTAGAVHCLNVCHPFCRQRDKMRHLVKCLLHDSRTGMKESPQKDKLVSELGVSPRNK